MLGKDPSGNTDKKFIEESSLFFGNPEFFQVFKYKWLSGSPDVLKDPGATVLSQKMAEKYFGNWQEAVGQYIKVRQRNYAKGEWHFTKSSSKFRLSIMCCIII